MYNIWNRVKEKYKDTEILGNTTRHNYIYLSYCKENVNNNNKTKVSVINDDMISIALKSKHKVLLLNMANPYIPGGNPNLIGAQEEDLFRRSNLYKYLPSSIYPIKNDEVLLSTNVEIFSAGLRENYKLYDTPKYVDIISCPGIINKSFGPELSFIDANKLKIKLDILFQTAIKKGYKHLILSALGCGGFNCPPEHVSKIFKNKIKIYNGNFEHIIFAIYDDNYPKSNYQIFKNTLKNNK